MLLTVAYFAQALDLITYLAMGREFEANPIVMSISLEFSVLGKLLLLLTIVGTTYMFVSTNKYKPMMIFLLGFGFVMGSIGTISNTLVLTALEITR